MEGSSRKFEMAMPPRSTTATETPKVEKAQRRPIEETETSVSYLGVKLPKAEDSAGPFVPGREQYEDFINDEFSLELQKKMAVSFSGGDPLLVEGGTSIGKTTTVRKMCAELGYEVHYVNLTGETDIENLMGRYVPNPHRKSSEDPEYIFADGKVTSGLRREKGKKKVIILDELNGGKAEILLRLHEVLDALERNGQIILSEDASEAVPTNKDDTHIIGLMNTPGKGNLGLVPLSPPLLRRWVYIKEASQLPEKAVTHRVKALFSLAPKTESVMSGVSFLLSRDQRLSPEQVGEIPGIALIVEKYLEFHKAAKELTKNRHIAADQPQPFSFDDSEEPRRVRNFVALFYNGDINETFQQALRYYYVNKLESAKDRQKIEELVSLVEVAAEPVASKRKAVAEEEPGEEGHEDERTKLDAKKRELLAMGLPPEHATIIKGETGTVASESAIELVAAMRTKVTKRALECGVTLPVDTFPNPTVPETLEPEHIRALEELFGSGNLEALIMPDSKRLTDDYFKVMYPAKQEEKDKARGLVSHHPSWWDQKADTSVVGPAEETWGQAYVRSMRSEAKKFEGVVLLTESIQKPNYTDGKQQYGTKEGKDATKDALLPLIRKVFGKDASRFSLSWDQINDTLLPSLTKAIEAKLGATDKKPIPKFEIVATPALASNLSMTLNHPENSQTNTYEWTSTRLIKQDDTDSGHRLIVGSSGYGGAGCVNDGTRGTRVTAPGSASRSCLGHN